MTLDKFLKSKYILASKSQRRIKLLKQIGLDFHSIDSKVKEINSSSFSPLELVRINSVNKALEVAKHFKKEIVIAADTIVVSNGKVLNKPSNLIQARKHLRLLSGKKHVVYTGINLIDTSTGKSIFGYEKTYVHFRKLTTEEIMYYVKTYKPLDKAGAYGIQDDFGCLFIEKITGDYYNVVGFPLVKFYKMLSKIL